jgi:hypothetical protein
MTAEVLVRAHQLGAEALLIEARSPLPGNPTGPRSGHGEDRRVARIRLRWARVSLTFLWNQLGHPAPWRKDQEQTGPALVQRSASEGR